ncbi:hypothetical protein PHMEG_0008265 [Phytophthora megakarya]|uniref:Uncharacterized protein n=1 Tax=Phytophthora megakarya TaxID=4795 RepID=A0A225WKG9_9STRA|nr:hypothetical protein PHMEG_0008265 [Phytophthora megakarya]
MRRHRISLRTKTRQGLTTPEDAAKAAQAFRTEVLRTIVEGNVFNADQTVLQLCKKSKLLTTLIATASALPFER